MLSDEDIELKLFAEAIFLKYGYDFRDYATASFKRRVNEALNRHSLKSISMLQERILSDRHFFSQLLCDLMINVTELFRDPSFYLSVRKNVVPLLKSFSRIKVWHAGCSTGEEVYSFAILLQEEELLKRCIIYATDISPKVLDFAKKGVYPTGALKKSSSNYFDSGGLKSLSHYFTTRGDSGVINSYLKDPLVFSDHNLATDASFGEMQLVICRNVLIYFNRDLQERATTLFTESLCPGGVLCLGEKETLRLSQNFQKFFEIDDVYKIYKRKLRIEE